MPTYSYKCNDCNNKFEIIISIKEKEEKNNKPKCPKCKSKNTKEVFSLKSFFSSNKDGDNGCCCSGRCS